eukprot:CAMPEP_0196580854 /NCGR_PEP_ID=MMETSP1081-20130531/31051_1 /TAXON_ID=36882 /ORGANISM="Pyramimonas amylifera, Strain CCMP720" /LENGTH=555 /DNA_ID=CAMNT_0041900865 /DNA_START=55 /DNA_END=1722 /DNA_ORIENTATION=-
MLTKFKTTKEEKKFAGPDFDGIATALIALYHSKVKGVEEFTLFDRFHSQILQDSEFSKKPQVLLIGQYSTGKTSFIRWVTGKDFPGMHIGPEPTTEGFMCLMHGPEDIRLPGSLATADTTRPFAALKCFGDGFLTKFQVSETDAKVLRSVTLVDTPGILAGEKQTLGRQYDYVKVVKWFAERADMILLLFDAHKVDISDEFKKVISALQKHDEKVRLVINKADALATDELMHVYGGVMWFLGKVFTTPEVKRSYVSSFWDERELQNPELSRFMEAERQKLIDDLETLPAGGGVRRVNEFVRRVRSLRVHLLILNHLRKSLPMMGKEDAQEKLLRDLDLEFQKVARLHQLPQSDFPDAEQYRLLLREGGYKLDELPKGDKEALDNLTTVLDHDIPHLLRHFAKEVGGQEEFVITPSSERKGWLNFKGLISKSHSTEWKRRYVVCQGGKMNVLRKAEDLAPKYVYSLANGSVGALPESPCSFCIQIKGISEVLAEGKKTSKKKEETEIVQICCEDADDMSLWLKTFQVHCCTAEDMILLQKMEEANLALSNNAPKSP